MTRAFRLRDILLLHQLGGETIRMDMPQAMIQPHSPVWLSTLAAFFHSAGSAKIFVADENDSGPQAWAQLVADKNAPEWRFVRIAPAAPSEQAMLSCQKLVRDICRIASHESILRLYAQTQESTKAANCFRSMGFEIYAREQIWRLNLSAALSLDSTMAVRPLATRDTMPLHQLYRRVTPPAVQAAEGQLVVGDAGVRSWALESVYVWENQSQLTGYIGFSSGTRGYVLRVIVHPAAAQGAESLLAHALQLIGSPAEQPVYIVVRDYESGIRPLLQVHECELMGQQALMVKNLAIRLSEPALKLGAAYEQRIEPAAPHTCEEFPVRTA